MREEAYKEAQKWFDELGGWRWNDLKSSATLAVAEYIVNKQGYSLWEPA